MSISELHDYVKVQKFGGSSIGSPEGLGRVARIVSGEAERSRLIVVVSALSGVTDLLEDISNSGSPETSTLVERHLAMARKMLRRELRAAYLRELDRLVDELHRDLADQNAPDRRERIVAFGERMSAPLVAAVLRTEGLPARTVDARTLIRTNDGTSDADVDRAATTDRIRAWYADFALDEIPVVTGFLARSHDGRTTLLGRGGSDYTAALIAEAVEAAKLDRWTDVDGLHTADPNIYDGARSFLFMLLEDATTWNRASDLGMHRRAFEPARRACLPVHVRSTHHPERDGTLIMPRALAGRVEEDSRTVLARCSHGVNCSRPVGTGRVAR